MKHILFVLTFLIGVQAVKASPDDPFYQRRPLLNWSFPDLFWAYYAKTIHLRTGSTRIHSGPQAYQAELVGRFFWEAQTPCKSYYPAFLWTGNSGSWFYRHPSPNFNDVDVYLEAIRYWDETMPKDCPNRADGFKAALRKAQQMLTRLDVSKTTRKYFLSGRLSYPAHIYQGKDPSGYAVRLAYMPNSYIVQTIYNIKDNHSIPWSLIESNRAISSARELPDGGQLQLQIGSGAWFCGNSGSPFHIFNPAD